ncbi:MAG TPA: CocE/NonD family hydrolase [Gaiellaceae bacterium]|nr:CocE/NonD family hydrolase [Gaiellaceae bacterium]
MPRLVLTAVVAALVLVAGEAPAASFARQELSIPMDDGTSIAATLYVPEGEAPAGGWPGLVFLHGLAGDRQQTNAIAEGYGFVGQDYAVLTFDARGHGQSGGLVGIAGPREVADTRAVRDWLAARPDVSDARIGAWGISYGGGGALNSLVAGVPWAALVVVETWSDLYTALAPQGLVKTGLVAGLAASIPEPRRDPSLLALQTAVLSGNAVPARPWAAERSSLSKLGSVTTPVLIAQGRRDFLFGLGQGSTAFERLRGPKALYVGLHGHTPSSFPAADTGYLMTQARAWFDTYLRGAPATHPPTAVAVASERFVGAARWTTSLPRTVTTTLALPGVSTFAPGGKSVRTTTRLRKSIEVFGSPTVRVPVAATGGWSRLVAVLTARTPQGKEIVVGAGGIPTRNGRRTVTIRLFSQATFVPRRSRLTLTLASSSTAHSSSNLLYLDQPPLPASARVRIGTAVLGLPGLRAPVTR